jgi:PHD/YefM family antitoxin component YafN of YafNO toxin-antitoxin module
MKLSPTQLRIIPMINTEKFNQVRARAQEMCCDIRQAGEEIVLVCKNGDLYVYNSLEAIERILDQAAYLVAAARLREAFAEDEDNTT